MQNDNSKFKIEFNRRLVRFSLAIIKLCQEIRKDRNLWAIADQLIRSATSVGANVIEAKANQLLKEADEIAKIIGAGVLTMKGRK